MEGFLFPPSSAWAFLPAMYDVETVETGMLPLPWTAGMPQRDPATAMSPPPAVSALIPLPSLSIIDSTFRTLCTTITAYSMHLGIPTTARPEDDTPGMTLFIAEFRGLLSPTSLLSVDIRGLTLTCSSHAADAALFGEAPWATTALDILRSTFEVCR